MDGTYGKKMEYDPHFKGPLQKRSCTDLFCLIIFLFFVMCWSVIAIFALSNGDIRKLAVPTDSEGRKCGIDSEVVDKKYLLFFDLTKCVRPTIKGTCPTTQVCVSECPTENFMYRMVNDIQIQKNKLICKTDIDLKGVTSWERLDKLVESGQCTKWYLESSPTVGRCIPHKVWPQFENATISNNDLVKSRKAVEALAEFERIAKEIYHDIKETKWIVLGVIVVSGLVSVLYLVLLRWLATPFVYSTILIICCLLAFGIYTSGITYAKERTTEWLALLICLSVVLTFVVIFTIFLRKRIYLACQLIKESSKAVTSIISSLFFPILPWILHLLVVILSASVLAYLLTIWNPVYRVELNDNNCVCSPNSKFVHNATCDPAVFNVECKENGGKCLTSGCHLVAKERPWFINYFHAVNIVGFYWLFFFVTALGEMVLAATFATWYWTFRKSDVPYFTLTKSFYRTVRYHLGTLAFGSLIMTICRIIRVTLEAINEKLKASQNQVAVAIMCCFRCLFAVLERFIKFVNNNAYIMCAVHGKGFCASARDAFDLLMRNIIRVIVIDKVTGWLLLMGKFFITALTASATYWYYSKHTDHVTHCWVPVTMTVIGAYLIATVFFSVMTAAIDTLFLCFLEDSERNDGSIERPYFMSKRLRKLLEK